MAAVPVVGNAATGVKYVDRVADLGIKGYNKVSGVRSNGYITYGELDSLGRATKAEAYVTQDMIGTGSSAKHSIKPKGFISGKPPILHHRGHIIAKDLGGDGGDIRNITTLMSHANTPTMRKHEQEIKRVIQSGENVLYTSEPIYDGTENIAKGITLNAQGDNGYSKYVTVLNRGRY